jgi:signal transduction histidine kinase
MGWKENLIVLFDFMGKNPAPEVKNALEGIQDFASYLERLAHDLRTPVQIIVGYSEILKGPDITPENRAEFIRIIGEKADYLQELATSHIELSKIESGQLQTQSEPYSLITLFDGIESTAAYLLQGKNVEVIRGQIPETIGDVIETDPTKLQRVMHNLIGNATKFTENGSIEYGVSKNPEPSSMYGLEFHVRDTGPGIPKDQQELIFNPFKQTENGIAKHGGVGLGLAIAKSYVEAMGGKIRVESEVGKGTTFSFTHPYKPVQGNIPAK